jgi:hypothetical protein
VYIKFTVSWFSSLVPRAPLLTHNLAGTAANYVNFLQSCTANNAISFEPEVYNVGECIIREQDGEWVICGLAGIGARRVCQSMPGQTARLCRAPPKLDSGSGLSNSERENSGFCR